MARVPQTEISYPSQPYKARKIMNLQGIYVTDHFTEFILCFLYSFPVVAVDYKYKTLKNAEKHFRTVKQDICHWINDSAFKELWIFLHSLHPFPCKFLSKPCHEKTCLQGLATRQDSNQPAQLMRLARALKFWLRQVEVLYYPGSEQQMCWSDCGDVQADLCLCCSHMA